MRAQSLRSLLTRQWMLFAVGLALVFATAGLLLLLLLEDKFIDRELRMAALSVSQDHSLPASIAPEFSVFPIGDVPLDIHAKVPFAHLGQPFEMRRANRRYIHALVDERPGSGKFVLIYDVTDRLTVTSHLGVGLMLVLSLTIAALLTAFGLVQIFVGRIARHAARLSEDVRSSPGPAHLRHLADDQNVLEFRHLLRLHADIWDSQIRAVERERQTLAYLSHELRTPLQSAQTSLVLLEVHCANQPAFDRLRRSHARLKRASQSALWLATDRELDLSYSIPLLPTVQVLAAEFQPMASISHQLIRVRISDKIRLHGPPEIAETIIANLLVNAIQHGAPGHISIQSTGNSLIMTNKCRYTKMSSGFGFGLGIVQQLATRINWRVDLRRDGDEMRATITLPTAYSASLGGA